MSAKISHQNTLLTDVQAAVRELETLSPQRPTPVGDPEGLRHYSRDLMTPSGYVCSGVVTTVYPAAGHAWVRLEGLLGEKPCSLPSVSSLNGVSHVSAYSPGTLVYVYYDPVVQSGAVLQQAIPPLLGDTGAESDLYCDSVALSAGQTGQRIPQYRLPLELTENSCGVRQMDVDSPVDLLPGDQTWMTSNGLGVHIDPQVSFIRASEVCGVFAFYEDGCLRVTGETLQLESPAKIQESGQALAECYGYTQEFIYPWEIFGETVPSSIQYAVNEGGTPGLNQAYYDLPQDKRALPRIETHTGYLGQGSQQIISVPTGEDQTRRGVFREFRGLTGAYVLETVDQLHFAKAVSIPVITPPQNREYLAEEDEYSANGVSPDGPSHSFNLYEPHVIYAGAAYANASAWLGLNAASRHPHANTSYYSPDFSEFSEWDFSQQDHIPTPPAEEFATDHRVTQKVHQVLSLFSFLPDGNVTVRAASGAELRLWDGTAELSGIRVQLTAAKTVAAFGNTVSLRGNEYAELSSSLGKVLVKAEEDLWMLGANSGRGGVLVESRSATTEADWQSSAEESNGSGVVVKADQSHVLVNGADVLLKSGDPLAQQRSGNIVLDAGQRDIISKASTHWRYSASKFFDCFGDSPEYLTSQNVWEPNATRIQGELFISGTMLAGQEVQAMQNISTQSGLFRTGNSAGVPFVASLASSGVTTGHSTNLGLTEQDTQEATRLLTELSQTYQQDKQPLNPDVLRQTSFGFPTSKAYHAERVVLQQTYWQQQFASQSFASRWEEPTVRFSGVSESSWETTRPWPGNEAYDRDEGYLQGDAEYTLIEGLRPLDPAISQDIYTAGGRPEPQAVKISEGMSVFRF